jgi:UDP-N-acetylglucosamine acyltransferase
MNSIHPTAQVIGDVRLGSGNVIGPLAVIIGPVTIGDNNWIGAGAIIGAPPEVRSWQHPKDATQLESGGGILIGDRNVIREYVQIHQGWHDVTRVGSDVFVMNQSYIAHDCIVDDHATLASSVLLAGHVRVGAGANLGMGSCVHQRCYVGNGVMLGMGSVVTHNIPPYAKAYGNPARVRGANVVGMERADVPAATIEAAVAAYDQPIDDSLQDLVGARGLEIAVDEWLRHGIA